MKLLSLVIRVKSFLVCRICYRHQGSKQTLSIDRVKNNMVFCMCNVLHSLIFMYVILLSLVQCQIDRSVIQLYRGEEY